MKADDSELLLRYAKDGDEAAFAEIVRRYLDLVYFSALRQLSGDAHRAEDVAQTVFTLLAQKAGMLARHHVLAGWLHTTTRYAAGRAIRTERRRLARETEAHTMHELNSDSVSDHEWARLRPVIDEALGELSDADREAVLLRYFANQPFAEVGARLKLSENSARMRVERALEKLHTQLAKRGVTSTASALGVVLTNQAVASAPAGLAASVTSSALAGAAAGSAVSIAGVLGFMGTSKIVITCTAVLGLAGLGTAIYQQNESRRIELALDAARREQAELRTQIARHDALTRAAEQRAKADETRIAALQKELEVARTATNGPRGGTVAVTSAGSQTPPAAGPVVDPMLSDPEYFRLSIQKYRLELRQKFWPLYQTLGLSPEQIAKFEANRTESQQAMLEIISSAAAKGVPTSDPAVSRLFSDAAGALERDLMALLGDAGYRQYSQYGKAQHAQEVVSALAGTIFRSDSPLTAAQGERLSQLVTENTRSVPISPGSKTISRETDWTAVGLQAKTILSPTQTAVFESLLEGKKLQAQMNTLSRAARAAPAPKPGS